MLIRDWAYVFTAALLLVQAGCNRGGTPGESHDTRATVSGGNSSGTRGAAQPGTGLNGGLGPTQSMGMSGSSPSGTPTQAGPSTQAGPGVPEGSKNLTRHGSVGNR
jgi:hypothetical protein